MRELTNAEISRQDFVDNEIFALLQRLNPTKRPIEWDIEMIGDVRDAAEDWMVGRLRLCSEDEFYPYVEG